MQPRILAMGVAVLLVVLGGTPRSHAQAEDQESKPRDGKLTPRARPELHVLSTADFQVTGEGRAAAWAKTDWHPLRRRTKDGPAYETRMKALHSKTGLYVLMDGTDRKITATIQEDFQDLWTEDVFEVFLWPDERHSLYFEYEISPLNVELPILVPNFAGQFLESVP